LHFKSTIFLQKYKTVLIAKINVQSYPFFLSWKVMEKAMIVS